MFAQREIFGDEFTMQFGVEDGNDAAGEGRAKEEGKKLGDEAHTGVVHEGVGGVETFFCCCFFC